jgi:hypothetical protein
MVAGSTSETEIIESHRFSFFGVWGDGLPRFDGPVLISDMRILGPPLTPAPMAAFGTFRTSRNVRLESAMGNKADVRLHYGFMSSHT